MGELTAAKYVTGLMNKKSDTYNRISTARDVIDLNRRLVKLPFDGCPELKIHEDKVDKRAWARLMDELGIKTIKAGGLAAPRRALFSVNEVNDG